MYFMSCFHSYIFSHVFQVLFSLICFQSCISCPVFSLLYLQSCISCPVFSLLYFQCQSTPGEAKNKKKVLYSISFNSSYLYNKHYHSTVHFCGATGIIAGPILLVEDRFCSIAIHFTLHNTDWIAKIAMISQHMKQRLNIVYVDC